MRLYYQKDKKDIVGNFYLSRICIEFIAMRLDLAIPAVIVILKEHGVYRSEKIEEIEPNRSCPIDE